MLTPKIKDIACKGGGAKGFIDIGVALEFERLGITPTIERVSGASVGGIFGLFFASGKPASELQQLAFSTNFYKIINNHWEIVNLWTLLVKGGLHDGIELQDFIKQFIKSVTNDENTTFEQWHQLRLAHPEAKLKDLYITACNISRGINEVFSYENPRLKDIPIWKAVAASAAFPGYFEPVDINGEKYSDGGLQDNCPIDVFKLANGSPNPHAIGIWLASTAEILFLNQGTLPQPKSISGPIATFKAQIESQLEGDTYRLYESAYETKMILCDNCGIGTLDFQLSNTQKEMLVVSGIVSVFFYFVKHYPDFASQYYSVSIFETIGIDAQRLKALGFPENYYPKIMDALRTLPNAVTDAAILDAHLLYTPMMQLSLNEKATGNAQQPTQLPAQPQRPSCTLL